MLYPDTLSNIVIENIFQLVTKIHVRRAASQEYSYFHSYMCVFVYVFICVTSPGHTNNDTDLKFGTHTPIDFI